MTMPTYPGRSKWLSVILALFLGWFGAHKFYLGRTRSGVLYLIFFWSGIPLLLSFIDAVILAFKPNYEFGDNRSLEVPKTSLDAQDFRALDHESSNYASGIAVDKESKPWFKSPISWSLVAIALIALPYVFSSASDDSLPIAPSTATPGAMDNPKPTQEGLPSSDSIEDAACTAMKSADLAVSTLAKKVLDGTAVSSDANRISVPLSAVNSAYKSLDGDFYWYLVAQGNSMDLLQRSIQNEDWYSAGVAIAAYLDADEYTKFCR